MEYDKDRTQWPPRFKSTREHVEDLSKGASTIEVDPTILGKTAEFFMGDNHIYVTQLEDALSHWKIQLDEFFLQELRRAKTLLENDAVPALLSSLRHAQSDYGDTQSKVITPQFIKNVAFTRLYNKTLKQNPEIGSSDRGSAVLTFEQALKILIEQSQENAAQAFPIDPFVDDFSCEPSRQYVAALISDISGFAALRNLLIVGFRDAPNVQALSTMLISMRTNCSDWEPRPFRSNLSEDLLFFASFGIEGLNQCLLAYTLFAPAFIKTAEDNPTLIDRFVATVAEYEKGQGNDLSPEEVQQLTGHLRDFVGRFLRVESTYVELEKSLPIKPILDGTRSYVGIEIKPFKLIRQTSAEEVPALKDRLEWTTCPLPLSDPALSTLGLAVKDYISSPVLQVGYNAGGLRNYIPWHESYSMTEDMAIYWTQHRELLTYTHLLLTWAQSPHHRSAVASSRHFESHYGILFSDYQPFDRRLHNPMGCIWDQTDVPLQEMTRLFMADVLAKRIELHDVEELSTLIQKHFLEVGLLVPKQSDIDFTPSGNRLQIAFFDPSMCKIFDENALRDPEHRALVELIGRIGTALEPYTLANLSPFNKLLRKMRMEGIQRR